MELFRLDEATPARKGCVIRTRGDRKTAKRFWRFLINVRFDLTVCETRYILGAVRNSTPVMNSALHIPFLKPVGFRCAEFTPLSLSL